MKVRAFVMGSAAILAVWLTITFLSDVPLERYPQYGRGSVPVTSSSKETKAAGTEVAVIETRRVSDAAVE